MPMIMIDRFGYESREPSSLRHSSSSSFFYDDRKIRVRKPLPHLSSDERDLALTKIYSKHYGLFINNFFTGGPDGLTVLTA